MSSTATSESPAAAGSAPAIGMMSLLIVVVLTVVLTVGGVAGAVLYLAKSGKLGIGAASDPAAAKKDQPEVKTHEIALEPLLVNLADADGHSYLRAGVTLQVQDPAKGDKEAKPEPEAKGKGAPVVSASLRDTVLDVLGRQQVAELILPDGKEKLKVVLKKAIVERNPEVKLTEVYFTEFLVQR